MGLIFLIAAVICEVLASFGIGAKFGLALEPLGIAFIALALAVGVAPFSFARKSA